MNHQYQSLQQEHQHQQALYEQLQQAYKHLQSEAKLIETVIVRGTNQSHQSDNNLHYHSGMIAAGISHEINHELFHEINHENGVWGKSPSGGGSSGGGSSPTKGANQGVQLERGSLSLLDGTTACQSMFEQGVDGSFNSVVGDVNNTSASTSGSTRPSRKVVVDASIGGHSNDTKASSNHSTSYNDHGERETEREREKERERSKHMSSTIAHMQNKIASLTDKVEDAVLCVQVLAEHGLRLQEQNYELIMQKQLLMNTCTQFEILREGLVDVSSACIMTQPPQLLASSLVNSSTAAGGGIAGSGSGSGDGTGAQMPPPIMTPSPSRQCGYEYQEAYDPSALEGFDRSKRVVISRHGPNYHRTWGGRGRGGPGAVQGMHRWTFRGVVIYVLAALRMKRLLLRLQQRAYGPSVVRLVRLSDPTSQPGPNPNPNLNPNPYPNPDPYPQPNPNSSLTLT